MPERGGTPRPTRDEVGFAAGERSQKLERTDSVTGGGIGKRDGFGLPQFEQQADFDLWLQIDAE